jgi:carbonic anhydrase/acetyltransferase-like protein (isoleucine patch superfamily)
MSDAGPRLVEYRGTTPSVHADAFVAPGATLVGAVTVGAEASVWFGAVARPDGDRITIGEPSNIQDGSVLHADPGFPAVVGDDVTVGHAAVLHGCTVESGSLIGMGSRVLNGARIGAGSLVAAGAVVLEGTDVPPGSLVAGVPAKVRRPLSQEEKAQLLVNGRGYVELAQEYRAG